MYLYHLMGDNMSWIDDAVVKTAQDIADEEELLKVKTASGLLKRTDPLTVNDVFSAMDVSIQNELINYRQNLIAVVGNPNNPLPGVPVLIQNILKRYQY